METKTAVWAGMIVGSTLGGFIPLLWGGSYFGMSSVILTAVGGIVGIYISYKLTH